MQQVNYILKVNILEVTNKKVTLRLRNKDA